MHPTHPTATADPVTPATTLRGAALYLTRHGWTRDNYYDRADPTCLTPPACALGAIGMAVHGRPLESPQYFDHADAWDFRRAECALRDWLHPDYDDEWTIGYWNDDPARTGEQVIAALNDAADNWDRAHGGAR